MHKTLTYDGRTRIVALIALHSWLPTAEEAHLSYAAGDSRGEAIVIGSIVGKLLSPIVLRLANS